MYVQLAHACEPLGRRDSFTNTLTGDVVSCSEQFAYLTVGVGPMGG